MTVAEARIQGHIGMLRILSDNNKRESKEFLCEGKYTQATKTKGLLKNHQSKFKNW